MRIIVLGPIGSDAGYWTIENGKLVHHGGWGIDQLSEVHQAISMLGSVTRLKTPALSEALSRTLGDFIQHELGHVGAEKGSTVVVLNAATAAR